MEETAEETPPVSESHKEIAVALSGGGFRASLFGLGAVWALVDLGANKHVTSIASVSGGSITNAHLARELSFRDTTPGKFIKPATELATNLTGEWSILRSWAVRIYFLVGSAVIIGSVVAAQLIIGTGWVTLVAIAISLVAVASARGLPVDRYFKSMFNDKPTLSTFGDDNDRIRDTGEITDHVICATALSHGRHVYLSPRFVYSPDHGWATPDEKLGWRHAVRASTALPVAFPAARLNTKMLRFSSVSDKGPRYMLCADGGVYDNLGDHWAIGHNERLRKHFGSSPALNPPEVLIVVNSSRELDLERRGRYRWPVLGGLRAVLRAKDIMYNNAAALRTHGLRTLFDRSEIQHDRALEIIAAALEGDDHQHGQRQLAAVITEDTPEHALKRLEEDLGSDKFEEVSKLLIDARKERTAKQSVPSLDEQQVLDEVMAQVLKDARRAYAHAPKAFSPVASSGELPLDGVVIEIDDSPFTIIDKYQQPMTRLRWLPRGENSMQTDESSRDRCGRADKAEKALEELFRESHVSRQAPRTELQAHTSRVSHVATTLRALKKKEAAELIYAGYVQTLVNTYVILGDRPPFKHALDKLGDVAFYEEGSTEDSTLPVKFLDAAGFTRQDRGSSGDAQRQRPA